MFELSGSGRPEFGRRRLISWVLVLATTPVLAAQAAEIGREVAVPEHLANGEEFALPPDELVAHGRKLFKARWTVQDGAGRPFSDGTGAPLVDNGAPLEFPRNFNRISGPDANACAGCHNLPRAGGAGDQVANVFVLGQRFDFATFEGQDHVETRGSRDERGNRVGLQGIANERNTVGMFGSGYIEMLSRQITRRLRALRNDLRPGQAVELRAKGIDFGTLRRRPNGTWNTSAVEGLPATSLASDGADDPPDLTVRPFHQAGAVVSLREFTNNAFNHHHGMQSVERFGTGDPDGDGHTRELTRADITAVAFYQATLAVPGRVIPEDPAIEAAVLLGEEVFSDIGCADCHMPTLNLNDEGWYFSEPNPYNPKGNLRPGDAPELSFNLNNNGFDTPRLKVSGNKVVVRAYTDFKLHDITRGPGDPNCEPLDMHQPAGSDAFFEGNCRFLTSKLWDVGSSGPYFHHGKFTTMREAIRAHHGEAQASRERWGKLPKRKKDAVIEFLKTLQILPKGTRHRIVNQRYEQRAWPPTAN
jgi:cytochrome c peroxidase